MAAGFPLDVGDLFEEHGARVLTFAVRMLGNRADAEDATQETFVKAYRRAHTFACGCTPSTWLFAIARNTCLDVLRARRPRSFDALEEIVTQTREGRAGDADAGGDAAACAERQWYVEAVREGCLLGTLACLSADQRAAFVLRVLCGTSTTDTAAVLGRTENAVRVLTHRARRSLKAFLCQNCSIYDPGNTCRCENLVGFSLTQGWIGPEDRRVPRAQAAAVAGRVAVAISDVGRLAALYTTLDEPVRRPTPPMDFRQQFAPHRAYYRDLIEVTPVITPAEAMNLLLESRSSQAGD
jgi:RNA polymerase sigma-70 factor (ECF subfamily)